MATPERPLECEWALAEMAETRAGRSVPAAAERLQNHLAICPVCRQAQEWDRRLGNAFTAGPVPATPTGLEQRVQCLVRRRRNVQRAIAGMAAALVAGYLTLAFWPSKTSLPATTPIVQGKPATDVIGMNDLAPLAAEPPVVTICQSQSAWLVVLNEACEGVPK
ncbi:hypothetical protein AYO44_10990 [Planctomycetaceae bacterium SCGC AG-212-F19]|nr:hypothetical protein AYO44_10990 [Planctomycetaceae bacterium SCGC AG-212-F19]